VKPEFFAYLTFTAMLVMTPGATTAVVVRNTLAGGRKRGIAAAAGAATANSSHAFAAGLGTSMMLSRSPEAITILSLLGAAYLAWLGVRSLYRVARYPDGGLTMSVGDVGPADRQHGAGFRQGLLVNLLNPAIATFYLVVIPSFQRTQPSKWYFALLAALHVAMAFACHSAWVVGLHRLRQLIRSPVRRRVLEAATGLALLAFAARVLLTAA
jgi:threonine/homoserine/homoserine lactone efflux protein